MSNNGLNVFTGRLNISAREAGECELRIRAIHTRYPQYSYTQVLNACIEMCSRHIEQSRVTLNYLYSGASRYVEQFEEIIIEQQEHS